MAIIEWILYCLFKLDRLLKIQILHEINIGTSRTSYGAIQLCHHNIFMALTPVN